MGRGKTREMALRVTRRVAEERSAPKYQSPTSVRRSPKASTATATPTMVRIDRSLWRKAFRMMSLKRNILHRRPARFSETWQVSSRSRQNALLQMLDQMRLLRRPGIVRHHDDSLAEVLHQASHEGKYVLGRYAVEVTGWLIRHQNCRIGHHRPGDGDTLLLSAGKLGGIVVHPVGQIYYAQHRLHMLAPLSAGESGQHQRQLHVLECGQYRQEIVELEDKADVGGPPLGKLSLGKRCNIH